MDKEFERIKQQKLTQINNILQSKFGKTIDFLSLYSVGEYRETDYNYRIRNEKAFFQVSYNEVPYLGAISMSNCEGLNAEDLSGINELINLMMGPVLYEQYLKNKGESLTHELMNEQNQKVESIFTQSINSESSEGSILQPIAQQIHFNSINASRSLKAALDLHHLLEFGSFLRFEGLQGSLMRAQELLEMGRMTLFVSEIKDLNLNHVDLLVDYSNLVKKFDYKDIPLLITASQFSKEDLFSQSQLSESQLNILLQFEIHLDRLSTTPYLFKESLELLLIK